MSRTNSRAGVERPPAPTAPQAKNPAPKAAGPSLVPTVRPTLSFANAAAKKESALKHGTDAEEVPSETGDAGSGTDELAEDLAKTEM